MCCQFIRGICCGLCRCQLNFISELLRTPFASLYRERTFLPRRNCCRTWVHAFLASTIIQWLAIWALFSIHFNAVQRNFIDEHPPLFSVAQDLSSSWPKNLQLSYNGSILSVSGSASSASVRKPKSNSKSSKNRQAWPVVRLGSSSSEVLNLLLQLQQEQSSARWVESDYYFGNGMKDGVGSEPSPLLQFDASNHNISILLGEREVTYTARDRFLRLPYERTDHAVHMFVSAMCNSQIVRSGGSQPKSKNSMSPLPRSLATRLCAPKA